MTQASTFQVGGGLERRIASRLKSWSPRAVAAAVGFLGNLVMTILLVGLGLILTKLLTPGPIVVWDDGVSGWFVAHRTSAWNTVTGYASILAGTGTVLTIAGATAVILAIRRLWYEIGFLLVGFFVEFSAFLTTVMVVGRPRPAVPKLDAVPATSSFPSGHAAAAIVLYVGLAILISSHTRHRAIRAMVWALASTFVAGVGVSRVYRGLHHPTDVFAGAFLGIGALLVAFLAVRAADAVSRERSARSIDIRPPTELSEVLS